MRWLDDYPALWTEVVLLVCVVSVVYSNFTTRVYMCFSLIVSVSIVDDRRSHNPPPYLLHKKNAVLPPPCPRYGTKQPTVLPTTPGTYVCMDKLLYL